jgi:hypothetical protein
MATIDYAPIQDALSRVRQLSADEEARRLAFVRERALRDEASFLKEARQEFQDAGKKEPRYLLQLLALKFGALAETVQTRVQQAEADTLRTWTARVLTAHSLEEVFTDRDQE